MRELGWFLVVLLAIVLAPFVWFAQSFVALPFGLRIALVAGTAVLMIWSVIYHEIDRRRNARYQAAEKIRLSELRTSDQR